MKISNPFRKKKIAIVSKNGITIINVPFMKPMVSKTFSFSKLKGEKAELIIYDEAGEFKDE